MRGKNPSIRWSQLRDVFFRALEAILVSVTTSLQSELEVLEAPVNRLLGDLEDIADIEESVKQSHLRDLLQYSKKLSRFERNALSIHDVISDLLDHGMNLEYHL